MGDWDSFVEATIDNVFADPLNKKVQIELTCAWGDKQRKRIVASGVIDFVVNEMRLSNIVDRVILFGPNDVKDEDADATRRLDFLMRGKDTRAVDLKWPVLKEKLNCIRSGALCLLEIEPVYGAAVLVLAEDFRVEVI